MRNALRHRLLHVPCFAIPRFHSLSCLLSRFHLQLPSNFHCTLRSFLSYSSCSSVAFVVSQS